MVEAVFAGTELGARIERAECTLLADCAAAIERARPRSDVWVRQIAGGVASYTGPESPFNKVAGLGFAGPVDETALGTVERAFFDRASPVQVELSSLADPSWAPFLSRRGYVLQGVEHVLGLDPASSTASLADGIDVVTSPEGGLDVWFDVVVSGFQIPDTQGVASHESFSREVLERVMRDMVGAEGFERYLARRDGIPVGGASMRVSEGIAQLCGSATLLEHRRRGVQTSLLAARLADARRARCDVAVITTQPGSKSQQNVQRRGFQLLYTRAVLVLAAG